MNEYITIGKGTRYPLHGVFSPPDHWVESDGPFPAVILIQGSGSSDHDETIFENRPFRDIADYLSLHGVGVLRFDKRSFTYGKQMIHELKGNLTVEQEMIEDALLAAELLRNDPRVDSTRIFLLGHSQGGMLAPRIDAEGGNFAGLIIMAGSPYCFSDILVRQNEEMMEQYGAIVRFLLKGQVKKLKKLFAEMPTMSEDEAKKKKIGGGTTLWYFKEMDERPAPYYLDAYEKPVLFLQGEKDLQVRFDIDYAEYLRLYSDKPNFSFKSYANLNHLFMPAVYGKLRLLNKEYKIPSHVSQSVLADMSDWILSYKSISSDTGQ